MYVTFSTNGFQVLVEGVRNRKVGGHQVNKDSSRSHSVSVMIIVNSANALVLFWFGAARVLYMFVIWF